MKFNWLNKNSREFLKRGYLKEGITAEERVKQISDRAELLSGIKGFSDKFFDYMSRGWYSLSSPVWANYGLERGLPISCYGSYVPDSVEGMLNTGSEIGMMSKLGGGTSAYLGDVRPRGSSISTGGKADGPIHYSKLYDTIIDTFKQAQTRRGSCAIWLNIEHDDINEWLDIKSEGHPLQNLQFGITVSDQWMKDMIESDRKKRKIWAKVIKKRKEIGFPYILFSDNVNNNKPEVFKDETIYASNLCSEIMLPSSTDMSFVCCLSSINILHFEDWEKTDAIETLILFLDTVMTEFINKTENIPLMKKARDFSIKYRSLGMGVLGYHSYLQSKMIPFESFEAKLINSKLFKLLKEKSDLASNGKNATKMALAPTKSSSFILNQVSMMIEPYKSNYMIKDLAKSKTIFKNPYLEKLLEEKGKNFKYIWNDISKNNGSVQHLDFLSDHEKNVFKTAIEISPLEIIQQAIIRQKYIDQGQSLNLFIHPSISAKQINKLYIEAWRNGIKSLYYQFSESAAQNFAREINQCSSCES